MRRARPRCAARVAEGAAPAATSTRTRGGTRSSMIATARERARRACFSGAASVADHAPLGERCRRPRFGAGRCSRDQSWGRLSRHPALTHRPRVCRPPRRAQRRRAAAAVFPTELERTGARRLVRSAAASGVAAAGGSKPAGGCRVVNMRGGFGSSRPACSIANRFGTGRWRSSRLVLLVRRCGYSGRRSRRVQSASPRHLRRWRG